MLLTLPVTPAVCEFSFLPHTVKISIFSSPELAQRKSICLSFAEMIEDSEKNVSKSESWGHQEDQSALIDITNDSPIVGLANGATVETPLAMKRGSRVKNTPGSGEALLRPQVKTLLLKVEEDVELSIMCSLETMPSKPQILNLSGFPSPLIPQVSLKH
ncbi:hypothetical protein Fmac_002606 [Flemingia macrophylla]|uniref:Uncharacterized protein n=1 Tax=Flemingia macrophylla TaxID=520843 RepID=A0ABD1NKH1_9FABA